MSDIFDPSTFDENAFVGPPPGVYRAMVEHAEVKPNSKETGRYLQVNLSLIEGEFKGEKVRVYINFEHQNPKTQNIGRGELKRFLASFGVTSAVDIKNITQLSKNKIVQVELGIQESKQYGKQSSVEAFLPLSGTARQQPSQQQFAMDIPF